MFRHLGFSFGRLGFTFGRSGFTFRRLGFTFGRSWFPSGRSGFTFGRSGFTFRRSGFTFGRSGRLGHSTFLECSGFYTERSNHKRTQALNVKKSCFGLSGVLPVLQSVIRAQGKSGVCRKSCK